MARISGELHNPRYIPITLKALNKGSQQRLNKGSYAYFSGKAAQGISKGIVSFQVRVAEDVACYPNSIVPIAGVIDYYRNIGVEFRSSRSMEAHRYLSLQECSRPMRMSS